MKAWIAAVLLVAACRAAAPAAGGDADQAELAKVERELMTSSGSGTHAGNLLSRKAVILERLGRLEDAARTYEEAAGAYSRSPEGTAMPAVRARAARENAQRIRAKIK